MIELLQDKINNNTNSTNLTQKYNLLREELQLVVLRLLDELGMFNHIAFIGGTALRILYGLRRFSEDLVFSLIKHDTFCFSTMLKQLHQQLGKYNLSTTVKLKENKAVATALIKFEDLLHKLGLSQHQDQKLTLKIEVDQNPPVGYRTQLSLINSSTYFSVNHFDQPSLYAGKLHALLCRGHVKGRDYYDFIWYVTHKITPNFQLLNNAIAQTEQTPLEITSNNLKAVLKQKFLQTNFEQVKRDLLPFIENPKEMDIFTQQNFIALLKQLSY